MINFEVLNSMEEKTLMPFHIDHVLPNDVRDSLTSKYDATEAVQLDNEVLLPNEQSVDFTERETNLKGL